MRELTKDLENLKGDLAWNYKTIPIIYGEKASKIMLSVLGILALVPAYFLVNHFQIGKMSYFFYLAVSIIGIFLIMLWNSKTKTHYLLLHNRLKIIIVVGVFSILLIDVELLLNHL